MNMTSLIVAMLCVLGIVVAASIALVVILVKPRRKTANAQNTSLNGVSSIPVRKWLGRILPIIIAIVLAFWSMVFAIFFLVVDWVMRLNPKSDSNYTLDENQKKTAKRIYAWLFWSPFITVPTFIVAINQLSWNDSSTNERVLTALIPLIFHAILLLGLTSQSALVYRHTQQGILLMALRATTAALAVSIGRHPDDGIWLLLLGNGFLWFFGTIWGRNQVIRGKCWWMGQRGETVILPEGKPVGQSATDNELDDLLKSLNAEGNTARQKALNAFRTGTSDQRKKAVQILAKLGEVETF